MMITVDAAASATCAAGVYKFFDWCDGNARPEFKLQLKNWLTNHASNIPADVFANVLTCLFGTRPLSRQFFFRTCAGTAVALLLVLLIYCRVANFRTETVGDIAAYAVLALPASIIPGYLSIIITRIVLRSISSNPGRITAALLLLADLLGKTLLGTITIFTAAFLLHFTANLPETDADSGRHAAEAVRTFFSNLGFPSDSGATWGLMFYPIFFSSLWVWLYLLSGVLTKLVMRVDFLCRFVLDRLDLETHPVRCLGIVMAMSTFVATLAVSPLL